MQSQYVSRNDVHDRSADDAGVERYAGSHPTAASPGGLFSHPDADHLDTRAASSPDGDQRSYTGLFREPADAPQHPSETA